MKNFSANKYAFSYLLLEKISCASKLSTEKVFFFFFFFFFFFTSWPVHYARTITDAKLGSVYVPSPDKADSCYFLVTVLSSVYFKRNVGETTYYASFLKKGFTLKG